MRASVRFEVLKRDRFTCAYCGRTPPTVLLEVDHVLPLAAGGGESLENLLTACVQCNRGKGARMLQEGSLPGITRETVVQLRERIKQARAYAKLTSELEGFTYSQLERIWLAWCEGFGGKLEDGYYRVNYGFPDQSSLRTHLRKMPLEEIVDAVRITAAKFGGRPRNKGPFAYFWAVVRNKLRDADPGTADEDAS